MSRFLRIATSILIIGSLMISLSGMSTASVSALAVGSCDDEFRNKNDILFFEPCTSVCSPASTTSVVVGNGASLPAETVTYLDGAKVKDLATANKARYDFAQLQTKVPWQVIAALHYREANMASNKSVYNGAELGTGINVDGQNVVSDPNQDAVNAANTFKSLAAGVYGVDITAPAASITLEQWGNAFLAYNRGYLYKMNGKTYDQSPYVMNYFDATHIRMGWVGAPADPAASTAAGVIDSRPGALALLVYLGGAQLASNCSTSGAVAGDVVKTALAYALDTPAPDGMTDPKLAKEAYRKAIVEINKSTASYPEITDCGRFISTIMRASQADTDFPEVSVTAMRSYMTKSPKYQSLGIIAMSDMLPGDILANNDHIMMYTGVNGEYVAVDASYQERIPSVRTATSVTWMLANGTEVWRLI